MRLHNDVALITKQENLISGSPKTLTLHQRRWLLPRDGRSHGRVSLLLADVIQIAALQLDGQPVQEALEEVLGGGVHHLGLDARSIWRPAER